MSDPIDRIEKLLRLATSNPNEHEAAAAAAHALQMMAENGIKDSDLSVDIAAIAHKARTLIAIRSVREANRLRQDADAAVEVAERNATTLANAAHVLRVALGRALIEARKLFPRSGPRASGWAELLSNEGLPRQTALDYMALAGHVEKAEKAETHEKEAGKIPTPRRGNPIPTYRDMGIKRDRKAKPASPPPSAAPPPPAPKPAPAASTLDAHVRSVLVDLDARLSTASPVERASALALMAAWMNKRAASGRKGPIRSARSSQGRAA